MNVQGNGRGIVEFEDIDRAYAVCFANEHGELVLNHLRRLFLDRRLPPTARDAELWYLEGQRSVVAHLCRLVQRRHTLHHHSQD